MATVIDALIVTLGLDAKPFQKGQQEAESAFTKTRDKAVKSGQDIEKVGKGAAESFSKLRDQVIELFAVFAGATGLKDLIAQTTQADAALGRFAANIAETPEIISNFTNAGKLLGASVEDMASAFANVTDMSAAFLANGRLPDQVRGILLALSKYTGQTFDLKKSPVQTLLDISQALTKLYATNPGEANYLGRQLGFTPGAVNALEHYKQLVADLQKTAKYNTTGQDVKQATALYQAWILTSEAAGRVAQTIRNDLAPAIAAALKGFQSLFDYLNQHVHLAEAAIVAFGAGVVEVLKKFTPGFLKPLVGFFGDLAIKISAVALAVKGLSDGLSALGDEKLWDWLDKKVPALGYVDDWLSRMTGGAIGRSYAQQKGQGAPAGAAPSSKAPAGSAGDTSAGSASAGSSQAPAGNLPSSFLGTLLKSESGGKNIANTRQGTTSGQAQGYFQITTGTWDAFGGQKYASTPLGATYEQQAEIASKIPMRRWDPITLRALRAAGYAVDPGATLGQNMAANKSNFSDYDPDHTAARRVPAAAAKSASAGGQTTTSAWEKFIPKLINHANAATLNDLTKPKLKSLPVPKNLFGAPGAAAVLHQSHKIDNSNSHNNSAATHIQTLNVNGAQDADRIARNIGDAISRNSLAMSSNAGLA